MVTKPSASSLPRKAAEPATQRFVCASKTPRSQSPRPFSRARTRPSAFDTARTTSVCFRLPTNFRWQPFATDLEAVTVARFAAGAAVAAKASVARSAHASATPSFLIDPSLTRFSTIKPYPSTLPTMPSRRDQIAMTDAEVRDFLAEHMVMQCATVGPRGVPHLVPLWYVPEGTELVAWTYAKSQKAKNLERDPRATVGIEDGVEYDQLRGVTFECDVEVEREPERVERYGLRLFERVAGELTPEIRANWLPSRPRSGSECASSQHAP